MVVQAVYHRKMLRMDGIDSSYPISSVVFEQIPSTTASSKKSTRTVVSTDSYTKKGLQNPFEDAAIIRSGINNTDSKLSANYKNLSQEERKQITELEKRDREVRAHEQAHLGALGGHAKGGAKFEYQAGPNGKQYAVGGEVSADLSKEKTPQATIAKMEVIKRAAMAPSEPSGPDRQVAAQAARIQAEAQTEIANERDKSSATTSTSPSKSSEFGKQAYGVTTSSASMSSNRRLIATA